MNYSPRYGVLKLELPNPSFEKNAFLSFASYFFCDRNHSNQYAIYDFAVTEHCLATNDKSGKMTKGVGVIVEMVFSMGATLGMVSEMSDGVRRFNLYGFSFNIEILDICY